jgi:hypothetical protein
MSRFPLLKGERLRATLVNSCGLPIQGPGNRIIIDSFVTVSLEPVFKDRNEIEQNNANGEICITDTTPPTRKRYTAAITICDVNTCLFSKFTGWSQYLGWDGEAIGFDDSSKVQSDFGVAIEVWTGGKGADDCPLPENDDIFSSAVATSRKRGYVLFFAKEFQISGFSIGESVSTPVLTGITFPGFQWGKGPYNVQELDANGTPGRMIAPIPTGDGVDSQLRVFRTAIEPPAAEAECCYLAVSDIFQDPDFYFGGPAAEPAAISAPEQPDCDAPLSNEIQSLTFTGTTTLSFNGAGPTAALGVATTQAALQTALEGLSSIGVGNVTVTGTAPGPWTIEFVGDLAGTDLPLIAAGTPANATIAETQKGGHYIP